MFMDADYLDWKDRVYVNPWRREDMPLERDESEMDMKFNWTGITVFAIPSLPENVEPEMTDLTARPQKPLSQPNEPSEQQRQIHNLTICLLDLGANTVFAARPRSSKV